MQISMIAPNLEKGNQMQKVILAAIFSIAFIAGPNIALAGSNSKIVEIAMMSPALINLETGEEKTYVINICNDAKMACVHGVDTCCGGNACPEEGVCP